MHLTQSIAAPRRSTQQRSIYFHDSYEPFGGDAARSPDGAYVDLKDRTRDCCDGVGTTIYDRNEAVPRDINDTDSPYRQSWY